MKPYRWNDVFMWRRKDYAVLCRMMMLFALVIYKHTRVDKLSGKLASKGL